MYEINMKLSPSNSPRRPPTELQFIPLAQHVTTRLRSRKYRVRIQRIPIPAFARILDACELESRGAGEAEFNGHGVVGVEVWEGSRAGGFEDAAGGGGVFVEGEVGVAGDDGGGWGAGGRCGCC